jgi:hypothetical protein
MRWFTCKEYFQTLYECGETPMNWLVDIVANANHHTQFARGMNRVGFMLLAWQPHDLHIKWD